MFACLPRKDRAIPEPCDARSYVAYYRSFEYFMVVLYDMIDEERHNHANHCNTAHYLALYGGKGSNTVRTSQTPLLFQNV